MDEDIGNILISLGNKMNENPESLSNKAYTLAVLEHLVKDMLKYNNEDTKIPSPRRIFVKKYKKGEK